uniref:smad nuclear-interacting protein 1 n=1 Tax=Myxine glutinosa TaxID=7769 RepID=UPI00358EB120
MEVEENGKEKEKKRKRKEKERHVKSKKAQDTWKRERRTEEDCDRYTVQNQNKDREQDREERHSNHCVVKRSLKRREYGKSEEHEANWSQEEIVDSRVEKVDVHWRRKQNHDSERDERFRRKRDMRDEMENNQFTKPSFRIKREHEIKREPDSGDDANWDEDIERCRERRQCERIEDRDGDRRYWNEHPIKKERDRDWKRRDRRREQGDREQGRNDSRSHQSRDQLHEREENDRRRRERREREPDQENHFEPVSTASQQEVGMASASGTEHPTSPAQQKEGPNFGLSGALTEDTNTYRGVVIKYNEPPEGRMPKTRWRLYPFKNDEFLPVMYVHRQSAYLLGRQRRIADIPIDHPSCSKQHAVLQYRMVEYTREDGTKGRRVRPYIIDLGSANGTYLNNQRIDSQRFYELRERDVIKFGFSSREYVLLHEGSLSSTEPESEQGTAVGMDENAVDEQEENAD